VIVDNCIFVLPHTFFGVQAMVKGILSRYLTERARANSHETIRYGIIANGDWRYLARRILMEERRSDRVCVYPLMLAWTWALYLLF
jgi:hypothetical protein